MEYQVRNWYNSERYI